MLSFFKARGVPRELHSFPTRRSSDLDVENTKVGARLSQEILTNVPTSRTICGSTTVLPGMTMGRQDPGGLNAADRKSTRLNSSHVEISYAVFCWKKKNTTHANLYPTI